MHRMLSGGNRFRSDFLRPRQPRRGGLVLGASIGNAFTHVQIDAIMELIKSFANLDDATLTAVRAALSG